MDKVLLFFLSPISAIEYWGVSVLTFLWQLGELLMIREILLSLLAGDYNRSKRQKIYKSQSAFHRLTLFFLKDYLITYKRLFAPYYVFYLVVVGISVVYLLGIMMLPTVMGYNYLLIGIKTVMGIVCLVFLRTKYSHGFRSSPKYSFNK